MGILKDTYWKNDADIWGRIAILYPVSCNHKYKCMAHSFFVKKWSYVRHGSLDKEVSWILKRNVLQLGFLLHSVCSIGPIGMLVIHSQGLVFTLVSSLLLSNFFTLYEFQHTLNFVDVTFNLEMNNCMEVKMVQQWFMAFRWEQILFLYSGSIPHAQQSFPTVPHCLNTLNLSWVLLGAQWAWAFGSWRDCGHVGT